MKNLEKRIRIEVPAGQLTIVQLETQGRKLYSIATGKEWDYSNYGRLTEFYSAYIRIPDHHYGFLEFFEMVCITRESLIRMAGELFSIPKDAASKMLRSFIVSSGDEDDHIDYESFILKCISYRVRGKVKHGTRYRIYCHPFIRNFLSCAIGASQVYGQQKDATSPLKEVGYKMETSSGDRLEIELAKNISALPGFTGREYVLLMGFWSVFVDNNGKIPLSALWETMHCSRWSSHHLESKEDFFNECVSLMNKVNNMARMCSSAKLNGRAIEPCNLFGTIVEAGGFYEKKIEGKDGSIGRIEKCHECDKVEFGMTRPELLFHSGKSVLPIPAELLMTKGSSELNVYLAYRVLRKIKMGDKAAAPVILSDTISELFGDDWSRKSAKHHMERLKQAGHIKGYTMTRRGIEFEVSENKKDGTTEP